jgi:hypothetical protein
MLVNNYSYSYPSTLKELMAICSASHLASDSKEDM